MRWLPRALVGLVLIAGVLGTWGGLSLGREQQELPVGTVQQRAAVQALLAGLPVPVGAVRDAYATSCDVSTPYCVLASAMTPAQLGDWVDRRLVAAGARHRGECRASGCVRGYVLRGVGLLLFARHGAGHDGRGPTHAAVVLAGPVVTAFPRDSDPLGSPSVLGLGGAWRTIRCDTQISGGCARMSAEQTRAGSASRAVASWQATLESEHYLVQRVVCSPELGTPSRCSLLATRFRAVGGHSLVMVTMAFREVEPGIVQIALRLIG